MVKLKTLSAWKNPPQDLSNPANLGNVDEERGGHSGSGKLVRTNPSQDPIEYSQERRQENTQNAEPWKQEDRVESSSSTSTRKLVRAVNTKKEFQNLRIYLKSSIFDEGFSTFAKEAMKTHVFVNESSHASWTKLYREFGSIQEHELRGNSKFVQDHTETDMGTF